MATQAETGAATPPTDELFKQPRPLDAALHASLMIDRKAGFGFARQHISIPVTLGEFVAVARDYPIVFAGNPVQPFAVLGLRLGHNVMVDEVGQWRKERYVPAHLRRYPFIFMETPDKNLVLCIDEAAGHFTAATKVDPQPLFVDGKPAQVVNDAMQFLAAFQGEFMFTREFCAAIEKEGLLVERHAQVDLPETGQFSVTGFHVIDEEKLASISDATFLDWRKRGWLAPIYFHLQSIANFGLLTEWASLEASAE